VLAWVRAVIVGAVVLGLGSRVVMRIVGALATPEHAGEATVAGNVVGNVTVGGSLGLMVPGAFAGGIAGLLYLGVRRWLPRAGLARGLVFGLLLLGVLGRAVTDGNERDFQLAAPLLALVLFGLLFIVDGLITALVVERVEPRLPPQRPSTIGYVIIGAVTLLTLATFVIDAGQVLDAA
jgi:hypothetical protein